ncbi:MAG: VTT domain-containing protein [Magnetococcales bacterium]|nr:VTT domain-containing protein [Magnetococcales bacterium]MBF0157260.1 VTT domain-containing protein [Magnetococcales bacterium]
MDTPNTTPPAPAAARRTGFLRLAALLLLAATIALSVHFRESLDPARWEAWITEWGVAGMGLFVLFYAIATVLFLPGSLLTLAGGALFGPWLGGILSLAGATFGAGLAFLIARHLAGDWVARRAGGMAGRLLAGVEAEGWRFVAFVRLVPIFPFNLLNYALGLTRLRLGPYLLSSLICMAPGGLAYAWLGYAGKEAASGSADTIRAGMWSLGLLAVALLIPRWVKQAREAKRHLTTSRLREMLTAGENLVVLDVRDAVDFSGENGHLPGSLNIPLPELDRRLEEVRRLGRPVAILCHTDRRSKVAFRKLDSLGIGPTYLVLGGIKQWRQEGFPVVR